MGEAMALTLVKTGTRLLVWNRTPAKAESFAAAGADVAREAADVFAHCATVFLMLVDGEAIDTVLDRGGAAFAARVAARTVVQWVRPRRPIRGSARQTFVQWADTTSKPRSLGHASPTPH
jgi:hypothetical protein